jgi:hypothetical protein
MRCISSSTTFYYKRVFPVLWFGFLSLFIIFGALGSGTSPPPMFFIVPAFMMVFGYIIMRRMVFDLVDEVWDAGDALIVRDRGREERLALSDIMNVSYSSLMNPPRVTLALRRPSQFGNQITFSAPVRFMPFTASPIIEDLIKRIDATRRN